jgi:hypothetical protein
MRAENSAFFSIRVHRELARCAGKFNIGDARRSHRVLRGRLGDIGDEDGKLIFFINRPKQFSAVWREDFG